MKGTVFMGQLPLQVAVLSFINANNKDIYEGEILSDNFSHILDIFFANKDLQKNLKKKYLWKKNYREDTVFHTIMRFLQCFPTNEDRAVLILKELDERLGEMENGEYTKETKGTFKRKLLFLRNGEGKTALQMAVEFGHSQIFRFMMGMKDVYHIVLPHDDIYEIRRFDVTEIDKVAMLESLEGNNISQDGNEDNKQMDYSEHGYLKGLFLGDIFVKNRFPSSKNKVTEMSRVKSEPGKKTNSGTVEAEKVDVEGGGTENSHEEIKDKDAKNKTVWKNVPSVAELLCSQSLTVGIRMIQADVFETIVRQKWQSYRLIFYPFFVFHTLLLVLLSVYAVAKAKAVENIRWGPNGFLMACNIISLISSLLYFLQEIPLRMCMAKQPLIPEAVHHNIVYRVMMVMFSICLFTDSVLNLFLPTMNNWFLLVGLVLGTWILLFFLRVFKHFGVFIVLINEGLFKAVLPFAVLIMIQLFVFSVCMHTIFHHPEPQAAPDEYSDFETYGKTLLMMGKLMIGLEDFQHLLSTREDVLAVLFFAIFLLVIFLLMINALIGVMTNRFQDTQLNKQYVLFLQQLSVVVFIEGWLLGCNLFKRLAWKCGRKPRSEEGSDAVMGSRFVLSYRKIPSATADNPSNIEHLLHKDRKKLDEISERVNEILEYQATRPAHGTKTLRIYDYSRRF